MQKPFSCSLILLFTYYLPVMVIAAEYTERDILPIITSVTFNEEQIGLVSAKILPTRKPHFMFNRQTRKISEISERNFEKLFPSGANQRLPTVSFTRAKNIIASDGITNRGNDDTCYYKPGGSPTSRFILDGREIKLPINGCATVEPIVSIGDKLWIGTHTLGGHGVIGSDGVMVVSRNGGEFIKKIDTGKWKVHLIQYDPKEEMVWVSAGNNLYLINKKLSIEAKYYFYTGFNELTALPEIIVSNEPNDSHPLAVVAQELSETRRKAFYNEVRGIPKSIYERFSLYYFFMCCDFVYSGDLPNELNVMIPFFIEAGKASPTESDARYWRQAMCRFADKNAKTYCEKNPAKW